jgi:hypothetical protein
MSARSQYPAAISDYDVRHPRTASAFHSMKLLVGAYLSVSALTLVAIVLLRNDASAVNAAVWIRGSIVVISAALMFAFTVRAVGGSRAAFRRVRIISAVMVVAIAVIIALPGTFPTWMKIEQGVCGLILLGVIVVVNGRPLRSSFAAK